jgi:hypothetical protein
MSKETNSMSFMGIKFDDLIDEGPYEAKLQGVEKRENQHGEYLHWKFLIPELNAEVAGFSSTSESTQAKAFRWAVAINAELAFKTGWDLEDVVGKPCMVVVETYEDSNGRERNKVVKVKPVNK